MECLAKTVRIVPVVAGKGVCECVAFGFEHYSLSVIFIQDLIYSGCAGIGWDEKHSQRWFLRFLHICLVLACSVVSLHLLLVFHHFCFVDFTKPLVDWFDEISTESQSSFAGGCAGCYKEEKIGVYRPFVVYAGDIWYCYG